jgi:hypothetical protein
MKKDIYKVITSFLLIGVTVFSGAYFYTRVEAYALLTDTSLAEQVEALKQYERLHADRVEQEATHQAETERFAAELERARLEAEEAARLAVIADSQATAAAQAEAARAAEAAKAANAARLATEQQMAKQAADQAAATLAAQKAAEAKAAELAGQQAADAAAAQQSSRRSRAS